MKCSPLNAACVHDLMPILVNVMQRQFHRVHHDLIVDAVSSAVEKCLNTTFLETGRKPGEIFRWLKTAAFNDLRHEFRARRRYVDIGNEEDVVENLVDGARADTDAMRSVLWAWLVAKLGPVAAETVWLHDVEGCPPRDIAVMQKVHIAAIKARIARARRMLRRHLRNVI